LPRKPIGCHWRFCRPTVLWRAPPEERLHPHLVQAPEAPVAREPLAPHWITGFSRVKYGAPGTVPTGKSAGWARPWPLPNLWPGVSVEDQDRIAPIGDLLKTPATRWVCFEPLLGRVMPEAVPVGDGYFYSLPGGHYTIDGCRRAVAIDRPGWQPLDWVVAAGEIGANAPPDASGLAPRALRPMRCSRHPLFLQALGRLGSGVGGGACSNSGSRRQARCGPTSRSSQLGRHARSGKHQMRKSCAISGEYADRPLATPGHAANSAALVASMGRWRGLGSRHRSPKPGHARIRTW